MSKYKYLSPAVLERNTPSCRDDAISICYILFELADIPDGLPWRSTRLDHKIINQLAKAGKNVKRSSNSYKNALREEELRLKKQLTGSKWADEMLLKEEHFPMDIMSKFVNGLGQIYDHCNSKKLEKFPDFPDYSFPIDKLTGMKKELERDSSSAGFSRITSENPTMD